MFKLKYVFCLLPFVASSQGYQVNLQGQAQQGMGSAGTATIQDAATVFYNPGGISFLENNAVSFGVTPTFSNVQFEESNTNAIAHTTSPVGTPFTLYSTFKPSNSDNLSFGLGVYTPFGSTVEWEDDWVGRFTITRLQLLSIFVQPTVSYKITEKIGIGAGFVYTYGKVNLQKDIPVQFQNGDYASAELSGTSNGFGFNSGIYFEPTDKISLGLSYRSQINMNLNEGVATFTVPESLEEKFPSGKFTSSLPLPQVISFGIAYKPTDNLTFAADVNRVGWSAYDTLAFDYEQNTESLEDTKSPRNYESTFAFRIGCQYNVVDNISVRGGLSYGLTPVHDGYVTGETPDNDRLSYTLGLGARVFESFQIDASVLYTRLNRTDTNIESQLSGKYSVKAFAPGISLSYLF